MSTDVTPPSPVTTHPTSSAKGSTNSTLASVLTLGALSSSSHSSRAARLSLTAHHLYFLLTKIEELGIQVGPMGVRLENIHADTSPANYVSFLNQSNRPRGRGDHDSIHSVSSMRTVMSGISSIWTGFSLRSSSSAAKTEKAKAQFLTDLKYLYSAFTKIPTLCLSPDHNAHLISGYEEFPFDTAVPLWSFKNLSSLEIRDMDFRQFYGWDRLSDQLRSLILKRAHLNDPSELLISIVLDDMDKRRRRSSRAQHSPSTAWPASPSARLYDLSKASSTPGSPTVDDKLSHSTSPRNKLQYPAEPEFPLPIQRPRTKSASPTRRNNSQRAEGMHRHSRTMIPRVKRSGSASSNSSDYSSGLNRSGSSSNLLGVGLLPVSKWRQLRHLSLADNSLTSLNASSLAPIANTLHSLDLSSNLFIEIPESIGTVTSVRTLNLSNCMIESLHPFTKKSFPAISTLVLRSNRLASLAGIESLGSLERLDVRDNILQDPMEIARLTGTPRFREVYVAKNPFIKTHNSYRITIFNLFRDTPGYLEDISIDSTGPGFHERKQLRDRTVKIESKTKSSMESKPASTSQSKIASRRSTVTEGGQSVAQTTESSNPRASLDETAVDSHRRKRGPRRRIVDLAQDQVGTIAHNTPTTIHQDRNAASNVVDYSLGPSKGGLLPPFDNDESSPVDSKAFERVSTSPEISNRGRSLMTEIQNSNLNGETYRQKMEALKHEVGSNWLNVLSEQGWSEPQYSERHSAHFHHQVLGHHEGMHLRTSPQGILSGSRTLG